MATRILHAESNRFKIGWWILLLSAALMTLMHFGLIFILDDPILFTGFTLFNLYAFLILYIPFRRGEKWAWLAAWGLPLGLALPAAGDPELTFYFGIAALCVIGLLLTMRDFFMKESNPDNIVSTSSHEKTTGSQNL